MADNYISTNMESGVKVKEALERIESYEPGLFVWTEVSDSVTVNLKSPTTYSGIKDPGDYVIYKFSNGPAKIPSTLAPVLLSLRNGEICVTANNMVFMLNGDNWVDMSESTDTDTTIFVKSDIAPVRTKNCYWFDTSKYATEGYITLKYYDTDTSTWTSVFNEERYLKKSELDPDNKNTDVYDYITTKVAGVVGEYGEFMKHVANQLTYIHVSADDRKAYGKIITKDQLQTLLEKTYTPAVKTVIDQAVSDGLGTTALENSLTNLKDNITSHLDGHVTAEDITRWKNKAEKNHTHDYTQGSTKLDASQIVSGTFGEDQLPDEIKERYYKITAASPAAEFSSSSITAAMRKGKYHNGNGFYFETTDSETGKVTRQWYRIIDSSKVGTSNWAQGVVDFTATEVNLDWNQISGKPSSLEEFGITTDLYTKTEINEKFSSYDSNITELNKNLETANEEVSYEFDVRDSLEETENPKIDRIGLQIRKESTTFSDNATGSIPQIDAIIKTTDGKIYKATQNLNSTYTDYDGNKTTTTNAAEPIGASMCEKFMKEYEWRNQENTNMAQAKVVYGNGIYLSSTIGDVSVLANQKGPQWSDYRNLYYSKNGKKWNQILLDNAIKTEIPSIDEYIISDICYGNGKFVVAIITDEYHLLFGYSTNAIDWTITQSNGLANNYMIAVIKICYGNNKYSGLATISTNEESFVCYSIYSTDGINWNSNIVKTNTRSSQYPDLVRDICYGNNKFISIVSVFERKNSEYDKLYIENLTDNLYYSTDGINWTSTIVLSTFDHLQRIFYINNKFYLCSNMNYAYSTDGISWTKYTPKWSDGTIMDDNSFLSTQIMCKYDNNSLLGLFIDHSKNYIANANTDLLTGYVVCKSSDGITWDMLYSIDIHVVNGSSESVKGLHPSNMIYVNDSICIVSNFAFMSYAYARWIHYYWTVNKKDNNELSYSITDQSSYYARNPIHYSALDAFSVPIDTTKLEQFKEGDLDEHPTGAYRFSGWSQSNITFTKDTPRVTEITGTWNWVDMVNYSYSWNAPSYSDLTGLVTLPTGGSAYVGETVSVDTKYNSDSKVEVLKWTEFTGLDDYCLAVCYGNGRFIITGNNSNKYLYSSDGINWTESILPNTASINNEIAYNCKYVGDKFIAFNRYKDNRPNIFYYSTDGINWTEGKFPITGQFSYMCYGNGKFITIRYNSFKTNEYLYSTDGINWTEGTLPITTWWRPVCYGNGKFVAIPNAESYPNSFYYSTDGITWTEGTLPYNAHWSCICYGNGKFVLYGPNMNYKPINTYLYSTDGINWTEGTLPITDKWGSICYGSGIFILMGDGIFLYSSDGINWTTGKHDSMSYDRIKLCYGQGKFICGVNKKYYYLTLPTSYYQFSGWNPSTDFIINENKTISGTWSKKNKLRVSYSWSNQPRGMKSKVPSDEYYHYGDNVMVDTTYNNKSGYKKYGTTTHYFKNPIETDLVYNSIVNDLGYFNVYFIYYSNSAMYYSSNGINWNKSSSSVEADSSYQYRKFSNYYIYANYSSLRYLYTNDGITWTNKILHDKHGIMNVINNRFIYALYDSNTSSIKIYETSDCNTWQLISTISSVTNYSTNDNFIIYINNTYYLYINNATYKSTNLVNWQSISSNITKTNKAISITGSFGYIDNKVAIIISNNVSIYTTDGINWKNMPSDMSTGSFYITNNNILIWHTSTRALYTTDGINWKPCINGKLEADNTTAVGPRLSHCVFANNMYYILDNDITSKTNILYSNDNIDNYDTIYYQFSGWNKSDFNITADTAVGGSWSQVSAGGGTNLSELSVGDTFFLGKYQVESETPWDIEWEIVHQTANYQIAMTKQIIDLRCFDAKEPTNTDSNRKNSGNNNWQYSNIEQFLNSDQASWYSAQHQYDAPPNKDNCYHYSNGTNYNAYDTHKGFLYYWSADEKALLRDMTLTLANNTASDGGGSYTWTGKVWLPTYTQMGGGQNNSISEGEAFSKFTNDTTRIKSLHDMVKANNEYAKVNNPSGNWYYWMSSAYPSNSRRVRCVNSDGSVGSNHGAYDGINGLAPCICLPRTGWSDPNKAPDLNYIS